MNLITLTELRADNYSDWDSVVKMSKNGNFLYATSYFKYHENRFNDRSVLFYKKNKPIALIPLNQIDALAYSHSGLSYGGLVYGKDIHVTDVLEIFSLLKSYLKSIGVNKLIYKSVPRIFTSYPADEDLYALYVNNASLIRRDLSTAIFQAAKPKLSDSRKCVINKAKRNDVKVAKSSDIAGFHALLTTVLKKFDAKPTHSLEELNILINSHPEQIKLYVAIVDDVLVSGCVLYDFGMTVHTQYLASSDVGRKIGALDYLLSYLIEEVYVDKAYFSFGISTEDSGRTLNVGLNSQKEGFGARAIVHDFYEWDIRND